MASNAACQDREEHLRQLLASRMNSAAHTKEAFFRMADRYGRRATVIDLTTISLAALLTGNLLAQTFPRVNTFLAGLTGVVSFLSIRFNWDERAVEAEYAGEELVRITNQYETFYHTVFVDCEIALEEKETRLMELVKEHDRINERTPATDSSIYSEFDSEDVLENMETTEAEQERILGVTSLPEDEPQNETNTSAGKTNENEK